MRSKGLRWSKGCRLKWRCHFSAPRALNLGLGVLRTSPKWWACWWLHYPNFQIIVLLQCIAIIVPQKKDLLAREPPILNISHPKPLGLLTKGSHKNPRNPNFPPQGERHALASHFTKRLARHPVVPLALNPRPRRPLGRVNHQRCRTPERP